MLALVLAAALSAAAIAPSSSQAAGAAVAGHVRDGSGASLARAQLVATRLETSVKYTAETDANGYFRFLWLPIGRYQITAALGGFQTDKREFTVAVGERVDLTITLLAPLNGGEVTVTADLSIAGLARTETAASVTPAEIASLPLNGRNYLDLALLVPGASRTNTGVSQRFAETSAVPGTGISFSSQRNLNNTFVVDGLSANDDAAGLAGTFFSQEVIREFQVVSSGGLAEFGRTSSGIVNIATASGTNVWRGRAYTFARDDAWDAKNPLTGARDPLRQWQSGVTIGGPIDAGHTFLFANVERTANDRTGNVSVPQATAATLATLLASAGYPGPGVSTGPFSTGFTTTNVFARVDREYAGRAHLAARYSEYDVDSENARGVGGLNMVTRGTPLADRDRTAAVTVVASPSGSLLYELRAQGTHSVLDAPPNDDVGPAVSIAGIANFGTSTSAPTSRTLNVVQTSGAVTWEHGAHFLKAGGDFLYNDVSITFPGAIQGTYTFSSIANLAIGRYGTFQQAFGETVQTQNNPNAGLFVQDEWRARRTLTIDAGLRYDVQWLPSPIQPDLDNVSPRLGVAWAPARNLIVRASAGLFFDRVPLRATSNALQRDGVKYRVAVLQFGQAGAPVFPTTLPVFPESLVVSITTIDPNIQNGRSVQSAVEVERDLGWSTVAAGYQHLTGRNIIMSRNVNVPTLSAAQAAALGIPNLGRPDPSFGNISNFESIGRASYDGLTLALRLRDTHRVSGRVSYTLSRAFDDSGNFFFSQPQDASNPHADWGPSDNDQTHRLTLSGTIAGPATAPGWRELTGGWRLAAIFSYASALPFNVQAGTDLNNDTNNNDRPSGVTRNSARGFTFTSFDLRATRRFRLGASRDFDVLIEGFNVMNHANFLVPNNVFGTGTTPPAAFGRPTDAADPRQFQIGLRFEF